MDVADAIAPQTEFTSLSYDDTVSYEEQLPTEAERAAEAARAASLANRIGSSKVYLLSESSAAAATRAPKRKQEAEGEDVELEMEEEDDDTGASDPNYRNNAILFNGEPIAHLPTARLFAYAKHFDANPMGLEWVDDQTCVFVFSSRKDAREAFPRLTKPSPTTGANLTSVDSAFEDVAMTIDDPVDPDYTFARPFPVALWPPEERINQTLGKGHGLKGSIRMRWARVDDIKKKGAKRASQFYKKHGSNAGKELFNGRDLPPAQTAKRKRQDQEVDEEERRRELDKELDDFLAGDDVEDGARSSRKRTRYRSRSRSPSRTSSSNDPPASPPSKMRSDYIAQDGRTLLERTSLLRYHAQVSDPLDEPPDLASRLVAPLPRRRRRGGRGRSGPTDGEIGLDVETLARVRSTRDRHEWDGGGRERRTRERRGERPKKTQQQLDDELDAFLNGKD